jgi:valyl-tRNA synthetase
LDWTLADRWIVIRFGLLCADVKRLMESYNFGEAGRQIQEFLWNDFADWYVEVAKIQLEGDPLRQQATCNHLGIILERSLRLLHPFMPFVTEEAWQYLKGRLSQLLTGYDLPASIMLAPYPDELLTEPDWEAMDQWPLVQEIIRGIRNVRNEYKVEPARWVAATVAAGGRAALLEAQRALIVRLARVADDQLTIVERLDSKPAQAAALVVGDVEVFLPLAGLIDLQAERTRLGKELEAAQAEIGRREARLGNAGFVDKAPANVVQRERDGLAAIQATAAKLRERLEQLV